MNLVTHGQRECLGQFELALAAQSEIAVVQVQVGVTDTALPHADEYLALPGFRV